MNASRSWSLWQYLAPCKEKHHAANQNQQSSKLAPVWMVRWWQVFIISISSNKTNVRILFWQAKGADSWFKTPLAKEKETPSLILHIQRAHMRCSINAERVLDEALIIVFNFFGFTHLQAGWRHEAYWWPLFHSALCSYLPSTTAIPFWTSIPAHLLSWRLATVPALLEKAPFLNYSTPILYSSRASSHVCSFLCPLCFVGHFFLA